MCYTQQQPTTRTRPPSLAEIIREETDDGRVLVRVLTDIAQGKTEDSKTRYRLPAAMELLRRCFDNVPDHTGNDDGKSGSPQAANLAVEEYTEPIVEQAEEEEKPAPAPEPVHSEVDESVQPESRESGPDQPAEEISLVAPGSDQDAENAVPGEPFPEQSTEDPEPGESRPGRSRRAKLARLERRNRMLARQRDVEARQPRDPGDAPVPVDNARDPPPT